MKGVVFTEFMEMVEETFSPEILDTIIEKSDLPNDGAYTAVGTYDHQEIVRMASNLSEQVQLPVSDLLEVFGKHLFSRFTVLFPSFFSQEQTAFKFLKNIDSYIHVEVKKLYPEAELPRFFYEQTSPATLVLYYLSSRHFEDLAVGLVKGCLLHFKQELKVTKENASYENEAAIKITISP